MRTFKTISSPHLSPPNSVGRVMRQVLYALIPGTLAYIWYFGWGLVINMVIATAVALGAETLMLVLRDKPLRPFLTDYSAVLTAVLLAWAIPPIAPWWVTAIGSGFAIIFAKHLYGGLGYNPFNPAMAGYVVLLISFPVAMTTWLPPANVVGQGVQLDFWDTLVTILTGHLPNGLTVDAVSRATPLDMVKTQLGLNHTIAEIRQHPIFGDFGGKGWEWIGNYLFLGGLYLIARRIIRWHIPVAMLGSLVLISLLFYIGDPGSHASPGFHVFSGAAILGAFFIATDPVSAATTDKGRLIYGAGIGVLVYVIRTWGGYPDGVAFAVLLMNMAVPLIDNYTRPKVYGHGAS
ncbi:MAG: electron transport complex subunit RsxD [Gammaproteobacteria bacterium]|jgi:electron transport complex protein RnfD